MAGFRFGAGFCFDSKIIAITIASGQKRKLITNVDIKLLRVESGMFYLAMTVA
jgi:hypothetical protein